jgi:hypothetical protein
MTVYVADAHARIQRLASIVKMATVLEECTTEEQRSVTCFFFVDKRLNVKDIHKEIFLFTKRSVCHVKWFTSGWQTFVYNQGPVIYLAA